MQWYSNLKFSVFSNDCCIIRIFLKSCIYYRSYIRVGCNLREQCICLQREPCHGNYYAFKSLCSQESRRAIYPTLQQWQTQLCLMMATTCMWNTKTIFTVTNHYDEPYMCWFPQESKSCKSATFFGQPLKESVSIWKYSPFPLPSNMTYTFLNCQQIFF